MSSPIERRDGDAALRASRAVKAASMARWMSWVAAAAGVGIVALFLLQAGFFAVLLPDEAGPPPTVENPDQITATDSTLTGMDRESQPYQIKAKRGWQDKDRPNIVHMEDLTATFRKPDGRVYDVVSATGVYDSKLKLMDLDGGILITEGTRLTARMEKARVMVESKEVTSDVAVTVDYGGGTIAANGLQITDDGERILFLNGVKARFGLGPAKGGQPQ